MGMENINAQKKTKYTPGPPSRSNLNRYKLWPSVFGSSAYDLNDSYDWRDYLDKPDFDAVPVHYFPHAPLRKCWRYIVPGIKIEVPNRDYWTQAVAIGGVYWVATVMKVVGYKTLLRYEGYGDDSSNDFWMNLCSLDVHHVGWCAKEGKPLVPPKGLTDLAHSPVNDWKAFLVKKLTGSKTLPFNFQDRVKQSLACKLRVGHVVEVADRNCLSRYRPGVVKEVIGQRVRVDYLEDLDDSTAGQATNQNADGGHPGQGGDGGPGGDKTGDQSDAAATSRDKKPSTPGVRHMNIWCHVGSPMIRPVGWCMKIGAKLYCSDDYNRKCEEKCKTGQFELNDATEDYFIEYPKPGIPQMVDSAPSSPSNPGSQGQKSTPEDETMRYSSFLKFQKDMKFEAIDLYNNYYTISPVTATKIYQYNCMEIIFDGSDESLIVDNMSPYIFPVGYCEAMGLELSKPEGYEKEFNWETYLKETDSIGAPSVLFNQPNFNRFKVNQKLEATDNVDPHLVCVATVAESKGRLVRVHYDGWSDSYDQWFDAASPELFPIGWCEMVGYLLERPVGDLLQTVDGDWMEPKGGGADDEDEDDDEGFAKFNEELKLSKARGETICDPTGQKIRKIRKTKRTNQDEANGEDVKVGDDNDEELKN